MRRPSYLTNKTWSVDQVAEYCGIEYPKVLGYVKNNEIPSLSMRAGEYRLDPITSVFKIINILRDDDNIQSAVDLKLKFNNHFPQNFLSENDIYEDAKIFLSDLIATHRRRDIVRKHFLMRYMGFSAEFESLWVEQYEKFQSFSVIKPREEIAIMRWRMEKAYIQAERNMDYQTMFAIEERKAKLFGLDKHAQRQIEEGAEGELNHASLMKLIEEKKRKSIEDARERKIEEENRPKQKVTTENTIVWNTAGTGSKPKPKK